MKCVVRTTANGFLCKNIRWANVHQIVQYMSTFRMLRNIQASLKTKIVI